MLPPQHFNVLISCLHLDSAAVRVTRWAFGMYQSIAPLKQGEDYALFETLEYASLGNALVVPVASIEANALAHHYPIVWRRVGDDYELVAFISLRVCPAS